MTDERLHDAPLRMRGRQYEDYEVGQEIIHHWGRTLTAADSTLFTTLTLHFNPLYFNADYASALGHRSCPIVPLLVFNTVVGLSVEDLSEAGGPFLGIVKQRYLLPVYAGDTVYARSVVLAKRLAKSGSAGPVTWRTSGLNQRGETVLEYERTNLVRLRGAADVR